MHFAHLASTYIPGGEEGKASV